MQWVFATFLVYDTAPIAGRGPGDGTGFRLVVCMVALPPPTGICRNNAKFTFESRDSIEVAVLCSVVVPYTRLPVLFGLAYRYTKWDQGHQANYRYPHTTTSRCNSRFLCNQAIPYYLPAAFSASLSPPFAAADISSVAPLGTPLPSAWSPDFFPSNLSCS